ncbi:MAG: sensor histidine kinase, partial [Leptolyngbyaceae bacterium]|nr:sensor histidine kinase [Leptolyngbyaceae bacterium]
GTAAGADRVNVLDEVLDTSIGKRRHRTLMEWTTPGTPRQIEDPATHFVTNDDVAAIIAELHAGRAVCLPLEEYPEAFQPLMARIGIKVSGIAPIFIDGDYFGCLCFDKCVDHRLWSGQEMDVLTTAAGAIGAALLRQRLAEGLMRSQAEQQRAAELAKANDALKRSLNAIAIVADPRQIIAHILKIVAEQFDTPLVEYWLHSENYHIAHINLSCWQGQILTATEQPEHPGNADFPSLRYLSQNDPLAHSPYFLIDDIRVDPYTRIAAAQIGIDIVAWFRHRGVTRLLNIPLWLNEQTIGSLDIWFPSDRQFTQSQIELAYTFGQQITLASYLNHLFDETQQTVLFEERNRIASDIHDTLAQAFTGISLQLEVAKPLIHQEPDTVGHILHHISDLAKNGLAEARRSVWALYPPGEEYANLAQMLYDSVEQLSRNTPIEIAVNLLGEPCSLAPYIGMNLLRIGQEALTNALKHSQAQTVLIELIYEPDLVSLSIRDDGRGFTPPTNLDNLNGGFGLVGMYERCDRINAQLTILSEPGQGTQILVESPLG